MPAIVYICSTKLMQMFEIIFITLLIVAIILSLLCIKLLIKKDGDCPNTYIGNRKAMRRHGIKYIIEENKNNRH